MQVTIGRCSLVVLALFVSFGSLGAQELNCVVMGDPAGRPSPLEEVRFTFEGVEGLLCYGAPSVRDREVWGGLVPYGQPWRAGANEPTTLHISGSLTLGGIDLQPGSYSLYAIPGETEWTIVVNSNTNRWGVPISPDVRSSDVGSVAVQPRQTAEHVETLTFSFEGSGSAGTLTFAWERTTFDVSIARR